MTAILLRKTAKLHANNAGVVQKVNKKKRRTWGSAPHPAAFEKAGKTFLLLTVSVGAWWRVKFFFRNRTAALPERKTPYYKVFARPFSKGRVPLSVLKGIVMKIIFEKNELLGAVLPMLWSSIG